MPPGKLTSSSITGAVWRSKFNALSDADVKKLQNIPTEPGWYWARDTETCDEYRLLLKVDGEAPWLFVSEGLGCEATSGPEEYFWGPRCEIPKPEFLVKD